MAYRPIVRLRTLIHHYFVVHFYRNYYNLVWGTKIGKGTKISRTVKIDKTNPGGVTIGDYSAVAFQAAILTHDYIYSVHRPVKIGSNCFIGARSVIMPGVTIGDNCIIGIGSVVMRDVPPNSLVMGNPGRVMQQGIRTGRYGKLVETPAAASTPAAPAPAAKPSVAAASEV